MQESEQQRVRELTRLRNQARTSGLKKINGLEQASVNLANKLRKNIAENKFIGYAIALSLALAKDAWDIITTLIDGGTTGALINIFISMTLWFILFQQSSIIERILQKFKARIIASIVMEFIPLLNFLPTYTILIILLKRSIDRERQQKQNQLQSLQKARSHT